MRKLMNSHMEVVAMRGKPQMHYSVGGYNHMLDNIPKLK